MRSYIARIAAVAALTAVVSFAPSSYAATTTSVSSQVVGTAVARPFTSNNTTVESTASLSFDKNLWLGMRNDSDVAELQDFLTYEGLYAGPVNGTFGLMTFQGVKKFQSAHSVNPTGYFGPKSRAIANDIIKGIVGDICQNEDGCDKPFSRQLTITTNSDLRATVGNNFTATFLVGGGSGSYTITSKGDTPRGLSWTQSGVDISHCADGSLCAQYTNANAIMLSGTPTRAGVYNFSVVAREPQIACLVAPCPSPKYGEQAFTLVVRNNNDTGTGPVIRSVSGPQRLKVGEEGLWTINAKDSSGGSLTYSVAWGDERAYILEQQDGSTSVAPQRFIQSGTFAHTYQTAGIYKPIFTVANSRGQEAKTSLSVSVGSVATGDIKVTTDSRLSAVAGQDFSATFQGTGGSPSYKWSVTGGTLPPGLELMSPPIPLRGLQTQACPMPLCGDYKQTQVWLRGTPSQIGTFVFTLTATDTAGVTGSAKFVVTVTEQKEIDIRSDSSLSGTVGQSFIGRFITSGGVFPYQWSIADGAMPPGLTLSAKTQPPCAATTQGSLYCPTVLPRINEVYVVGTPTTAGTYKFRLLATDSTGRLGDETFVITISDQTRGGSLSVTSPAKGDAWYVGQTYSVQWQNAWAINANSAAHRFPLQTVTITFSQPAPACLFQEPRCLIKQVEPYTITESAPNTGSYTWTIPASFPANYLGEGQVAVQINGTDIAGRSGVMTIINSNLRTPYSVLKDLTTWKTADSMKRVMGCTTGSSYFTTGLILTASYQGQIDIDSPYSKVKGALVANGWSKCTPDAGDASDGWLWSNSGPFFSETYSRAGVDLVRIERNYSSGIGNSLNVLFESK